MLYSQTWLKRTAWDWPICFLIIGIRYITGLVNVVIMGLGLKKREKIVCYNQEFVVTMFVITEFDCIIFTKSTRITFHKYVCVLINW
jgi:hypothetical protein